jgi:hypothetical protein
VGRNRLAINRLWGGFDVALMWLWVASTAGKEDEGTERGHANAEGS